MLKNYNLWCAKLAKSIGLLAVKSYRFDYIPLLATDQKQSKLITKNKRSQGSCDWLTDYPRLNQVLGVQFDRLIKKILTRSKIAI